MRENIQRVAERGERLDALQDKTYVPPSTFARTPRPLLHLLPPSAAAASSSTRPPSLPCAPMLTPLYLFPPVVTSDNLAVSAQGFRRGANKVRKAMWWKDTKMKIIIGVGIAVLMWVTSRPPSLLAHARPLAPARVFSFDRLSPPMAAGREGARRERCRFLG